MTGEIKNIVIGRGYGFITVKNDRNEYFFHKDDYIGSWEDLTIDFKIGMPTLRVQFDVVDSYKGPRAANVVRLDNEN